MGGCFGLLTVLIIRDAAEVAAAGNVQLGVLEKRVVKVTALTAVGRLDELEVGLVVSITHLNLSHLSSS
jgi:hypothetical protein